MLKKYVFGKPIDTKSVVKDMAVEDIKNLSELEILQDEKSISFKINMQPKDVVYGLGENVRGINKRGFIYESYCSDDPSHTEDKRSLYGAHNFLIVSGEEQLGIYVDTPSRISFDVGFTDVDTLKIYTEEKDFILYIIKGQDENDVIKQLRELVGQSYIPPLWAMGYQQSRWGYQCDKDIEEVYEKMSNNNIPIDAIYLDIDYLERFKNFTVDKKGFPDFQKFVDDMKQKNIHLVPIIDAGVKIEDGYDVYEEGVKNNYFVKDIDGNDYVTAVWPGITHFPDFLNSDSASWFGHKYKFLLDYGIDGFWNDMNEPAIFYSEKGLKKAWENLEQYKGKNVDINSFFDLRDTFPRVANSLDDYKSMYHNIDGVKVNHDKVHNLYGYMMTKSASEAFDNICPDKRILLFSRASCIGMHRYGGIWQGDNCSWWSHLEMNMKMMPSINMCGFLYTGADLGGFGSNAQRELQLRWTAFALFTPIMRNHSAIGTRNQEPYQFGDSSEFKAIISLRYRLIPYLYSELLKSALNNEIMFKPLAFEYKNDERVKTIEDQLLVGESIMITPIYKPNQTGRYVYLPENMMMVKFKNENEYETKVMKKGDYYVDIAVNEVVIFIRENKILPLCKSAKNTKELDRDTLQILGFVTDKVVYELYDDDGVSKNYNSNKAVITAEKQGDNVILISTENKKIDTQEISSI